MFSFPPRYCAPSSVDGTFHCFITRCRYWKTFRSTSGDGTLKCRGAPESIGSGWASTYLEGGELRRYGAVGFVPHVAVRSAARPQESPETVLVQQLHVQGAWRGGAGPVFNTHGRTCDFSQKGAVLSGAPHLCWARTPCSRRTDRTRRGRAPVCRSRGALPHRAPMDSTCPPPGFSLDAHRRTSRWIFGENHCRTYCSYQQLPVLVTLLHPEGFVEKQTFFYRTVQQNFVKNICNLVTES